MNAYITCSVLFQVLVAIHPTACLEDSSTAQPAGRSTGSERWYDPGFPKTMVHYFDAETKQWKPLPSVARLKGTTVSFFCAETNGNYLYVAAVDNLLHCHVYRYHIANNSWETLPRSSSQISCFCSVDDYIYAISHSGEPQRYSLTNNIWQGGDNLNFLKTNSYDEMLRTVAAAVMNSKIYVIHGYQTNERVGGYTSWVNKPAVVHCFDPIKNEWEQKASTCHPHFGSSLFVVNNRLYLAGGKIACDDPDYPSPQGDKAPVEVYNEKIATKARGAYVVPKGTWSVVEQKHIPPNNLGAVEIEGRVYFIVNKFPIDSGIRIPPGEMYHVHLDEWVNLAKVSSKAVLCYLPVKRENLFITEANERSTDT